MGRFKGAGTSVNKGETTNLKREKKLDLNNTFVGLGWDVSYDNVDLDVFAIQVDEEGRYIDHLYFGTTKYNGRLLSKDRAIEHTGDNLTGEGDGDDESILINFDKLNPQTNKIIVGINIYQCRVSFDRISNAFVRLANFNDRGNSILNYDLSNEAGDNYSMYVCEFYLDENNEWNFKAVGEPSKIRDISSFVREYTKPMKEEKKDTEQKKGFLGRFF